MSTMYGLDLNISNYDQEKVEEIKQAAKKTWNQLDLEEDLDYEMGLIAPYQEGYLPNSDPNVFLKLLAKAILEANVSDCEIGMTLYFVEQVPSEQYEFSSLSDLEDEGEDAAS